MRSLECRIFMLSLLKYMQKKHLTIFILLASLLSACEPSKPGNDAPQSNDNVSTNSVDIEPQDNTLEHVAPNQVVPAEDSTADDSTINGQSQQNITPLATETTQASVDGKNPPAESIVESIGFADAEMDESKTAQDEYQPRCNTFSIASTTELSNEELATALPDLKANNTDLKEAKSAFCEKVSNRLASVSLSLCQSANLVPSGCSSVNGTPLMVTEFPPLKDKKSLGRVLIVGGIHGDELTSISTTFRWIEKLNKFHSGLFHWHIIPAMNPDGLLKRSAERTNENGIDLNRNLPSKDWTNNALAYWQSKGNSDPRRYPGKSPNSEPETHWLVDEINIFKPDVIISVHAPYGVVDFDAPKLNTAPKSLGKLHLNLLGTYPGSLGNYAGINNNIPVITLELPHAWEMPSVAETDLIWQDIVSWLKKNLAKEADID